MSSPCDRDESTHCRSALGGAEDGRRLVESDGRAGRAGRRRERISCGTGQSEIGSVDRFVVLLQIVRRASSGGSLRVRNDNVEMPKRVVLF